MPIKKTTTQKTKKASTKKATPYKIVRDTSIPQMEKVSFVSTEDSANFCKSFFKDDMTIYESFFIVLLNRANITIGWAKISQGGITATVIDPILIAKYAIESLAKAVVLCHNHPSGNLQPSSNDIKMTHKVREGLKLFDITLLDHIILTEQAYYSMQENGDF